MKEYIKVSLVLLVAMMFVVGCGKKNEANEEQPENDIEIQDNEQNENQQNEETDIEEEEESNTGEQELSEGTVDLSDTLEEITNFYNTIQVSDSDIIDPETGYYQIEARKFLDEGEYEVSVSAYTIGKDARLTLTVRDGEEEYESQAEKTNLSGGAMAEEVKEGVYEYADSLIWKEEGNSYQLKGGRNVVSTNEENNIEPAEDRLLFHESLTKTKNELDDMKGFLDRIIIPTTLPSDYNLSVVTFEKNEREIMGLAYPMEIIYIMRNDDNGQLYFINYGDYQDAPKLAGEGLEELEVEGVTVQSKEDHIMFTLGDETYRIDYAGIDLEDVLEIAKSMIVQFN